MAEEGVGTYGATLCVLLMKKPWRRERGPDLFKVPR